MLYKLALGAAVFAWASLADICVEKTASLPPGWMKISDQVDPNERYSFSIALKQPQMKGLQKLLTSARANMLSLADTTTMRAPTAKSVSMVQGWLRSHGIQDIETKGDWVNVRATVGQTDALIGSVLEHYIYDGEDTPVLRTTQYFIPDALEDAVDFIHPVSNFMKPVRSISKIRFLDEKDLAKRDPPCTSIITPKCVRDAYNFHYKTPDDKSSVTMGITGFLEEYANYQDSDQFLSQHAPEIAAKKYNYTVELVNGGENPQNLSQSGAEAALDVDYGLALAYPANLVFYSTAGRSELIGEDGRADSSNKSTNEPFLELFQYFLDKPDGEIPSVLSVSYADDEVSVPRPYAEKVCSMIGMLAGRGMTLLFGSGDGGAQGGHNSNCRTRDGSNKKIYMTTFPSTCPWALAVGAVSNTKNPPEAAGFSTGGFSQYFPQPSWQKEVVGAYVRSLNGSLDGYYEPRNRAIPDISAVGTNVLVVHKGQPGLLQGTSASTPMIAAMLAMVNDARARAGKQPLGWATRLLYGKRVRSTLLEVTAGESFSCDYDGEKPGGWPAKSGWDAVTGLGVPKDFNELLDALLHGDD
ncbi:S8/S53 family peptidase [Cordyceps fumosorosea ARSEF 2679]|uniref:tripeptidyl-peptidase II n=1 Tax=Cordyceps fumosorosea (strain ARSEF 2679) TaxID=1081104 RepID=A0A168B7D9_CORFA|nr:S8/S53 family peptidase [Cordyceps fumosorosea ARSEF 2679]OAA69725.1 S8/S53 family peptidase [Cordyceps fumosorosea ARSEF 2679]